jgi:hypothetical protein
MVGKELIVNHHVDPETNISAQRTHHLSDLYPTSLLSPPDMLTEPGNTSEHPLHYLEELRLTDSKHGAFAIGSRCVTLQGQQREVMLTLYDRKHSAETDRDERVHPVDLQKAIWLVSPNSQTRPAQVISTIRAAFGENADTAKIILEAKQGKHVTGYWLGVPVEGQRPKSTTSPDIKPLVSELDKANMTAIRLILAFDDLRPDLVSTALGKRNGQTLNRSQSLMILRNFLGVLERSTHSGPQNYEFLGVVNRIRQCTGEDSVQDAIAALENKITTLLKK